MNKRRATSSATAPKTEAAQTPMTVNRARLDVCYVCMTRAFTSRPPACPPVSRTANCSTKCPQCDVVQMYACKHRAGIVKGRDTLNLAIDCVDSTKCKEGGLKLHEAVCPCNPAALVPPSFEVSGVPTFKTPAGTDMMEVDTPAPQKRLVSEFGATRGMEQALWNVALRDGGASDTTNGYFASAGDAVMKHLQATMCMAIIKDQVSTPDNDSVWRDAEARLTNKSIAAAGRRQGLDEILGVSKSLKPGASKADATMARALKALCWAKYCTLAAGPGGEAVAAATISAWMSDMGLMVQTRLVPVSQAVQE